MVATICDVIDVQYNREVGPEMKKRKVSAFYTGLFGFTSIFFLVGIAFVMWFLVVYMQEDIASLRGLSLIGVILFLLQV